MLKGAGIEFRREARLDVAQCVGLPMTLVFLPAADIAKYVGDGNVDIGITGLDVVKESMVEVEHIMDLGFGKCKLCVQAPVAKHISDVSVLAGQRIVTSFPDLTKQFFQKYDEEKGVQTKVNFVSGSVEAACGLGLADAVVDLVETGTTMKVRLLLMSWKLRVEEWSAHLDIFYFLFNRLPVSKLFTRFSVPRYGNSVLIHTVNAKPHVFFLGYSDCQSSIRAQRSSRALETTH